MKPFGAEEGDAWKSCEPVPVSCDIDHCAILAHRSCWLGHFEYLNLTGSNKDPMIRLTIKVSFPLDGSIVLPHSFKSDI